MPQLTVAVALDLGTTAIKAGLLKQDGTLYGVVAQPAPALNVQGGRYESDALAYATAADAVLDACLAQTPVRPQRGGAQPIGAGAGASHFLPQTADYVGNVSEVHPSLGLCSQRSTFLIWERANGLPLTPLISWQDDRGAQSCAALHDSAAMVHERAGLPLTPYYLGPKLSVLLQVHPEWRAHLREGNWLAGTLDTFLIWRWTGGREYRTDLSMAARTLLLDAHTQRWSPALCELFGIPLQALPRVGPSAGLAIALDNGLSLQASVADQSAALRASLLPGQPEALVNLGTGGFVACGLPAGREAAPGYLRTLLWQDAEGQVQTACEGTLNSIAAALAPYPVAASRVDELGRDDIYCLAEPSGLGAPYFRSDLGLTFSQPVAHLSPAHMAVLLQEAIIFRVARILRDFQRDFGIERAYLCGGLSALSSLQQGIAQCAGLPVYLLAHPHASLAGAAQLAAGMEGSARATSLIGLQAPLSGLERKFACWQDWLDELLRGHLPAAGGKVPD